MADMLGAQGKQVTVVEMLQDMGRDMDKLARSMLLHRLVDHDVVVHTDTKVTKLTANTAFAQRNDHEAQSPIKTGVIAIGVVPDRELVDPLDKAA